MVPKKTVLEKSLAKKVPRKKRSPHVRFRQKTIVQLPSVNFPVIPLRTGVAENFNQNFKNIDFKILGSKKTRESAENFGIIKTFIQFRNTCEITPWSQWCPASYAGCSPSASANSSSSVFLILFLFGIRSSYRSIKIGSFPFLIKVSKQKRLAGQRVKAASFLPRCD